MSEELGPLTGKQQELVTTLEWTGYKLHIDVADGGIPICAVLTSASTHDSQVSIPLAKMSSKRVTNLYDLMDSDWMTVNYSERYDIFSPKCILFKHGIPLRRLKSVTRKFTDSGDTIKHGNWMFWSLAIWQ